MTSRSEDFAGKLLMISVFGYFSLQQVESIVVTVVFREKIDFWQLVLVSRVFALIFLALTVFLTVLRLPPKKSAVGMEPRITSIAGTFFLMLLVVVPTGSPGPALQILATVLIVAGTILSICCAVFLGRSFSIMATARRLVTNGPYSLVRHPLYIAEAITIIGIVIANLSFAAVTVGAIQFALQYRRMLNEERVLREAFPEYAAYAATVPMLVPHFRGRRSALPQIS